jgi:hypothetical protein
VKVNVTLTLDKPLLQAARRLARERETSVNQLVRDYLAHLVWEKENRDAAIADLDDIFRTNKITVDPVTWKRDYLHKR